VRSISRPFCALAASQGARACYDEFRARGTSHHAALRASSLAGILHGCLKTGTPYDGVTAWQHWLEDAALASKRHGCLRWLDPAPATTSEMARELGFPGLADC
jgi:hypothetical protein